MSNRTSARAYPKHDVEKEHLSQPNQVITTNKRCTIGVTKLSIEYKYRKYKNINVHNA